MVAPAKTDATSALQARMRLAFDMHEFGVAAYRCTLRRREPGLTEAQLDAKVAHWLGCDGFDLKDHPGFRRWNWKDWLNFRSKSAKVSVANGDPDR